MADMKLYILHMGYLGSMDTALVPLDEGEVRTPQPIQFPVLAFLIDHPTAGKILYDTGSHIHAMENDYWPEHLQTSFPLFESEETSLANQLVLCGTRPEDISTVVLSHLHMDHAGNIDLFPNAEVYVPAEDYAYAGELLRSQDRSEHSAYIKQEFESLSPDRLHLVSEDCTLVPGVDMIRLPGHAPDLLGLVVHLEQSGTMILPQDCIYCPGNYGPPARRSSIVFDEADFFASIEKVRELAQRHQAKVVFAHHVSIFDQFTPAPHYYQ